MQVDGYENVPKFMQGMLDHASIRDYNKVILQAERLKEQNRRVRTVYNKYKKNPTAGLFQGLHEIVNFVNSEDGDSSEDEGPPVDDDPPVVGDHPDAGTMHADRQTYVAQKSRDLTGILAGIADKGRLPKILVTETEDGHEKISFPFKNVSEVNEQLRQIMMAGSTDEESLRLLIKSYALIRDNVDISKQLDQLYYILLGNGLVNLLYDDHYTWKAQRGVNIRIYENFTPLMFASNAGNLKFVQFLLNKIDTTNKFIDGLGKDRSSGSVLYLNQKIDKDEYINAKDEIGYTALMNAAGEGHIDVVKELLRSGARMDLRSNYSATARAIASVRGHADIVKLLPIG